ncbi:hypothetical protein [Actinotalea sp. K2]|uniref:hypothetical protein n=1 Tax=Actinotalea sp. K2 TaxID=2939438 RepID=UPI002017595F|nr:hypothetical protein [Actinotalea sp. K2]MCL3860977.1 hypothetical protein [Actinotalea sp. K2]
MPRSLPLAALAGLTTTAILVLAGWAAGMGTGPAAGVQSATSAGQVETLDTTNEIADPAPVIDPDLSHDTLLPTQEDVDAALHVGFRVYLASDGTRYAVDPAAGTPLALSSDLFALGERLASPAGGQVETRARTEAVYDLIDRADATGRSHVLVVPTLYSEPGRGSRVLYVVATRAPAFALDPFEAVHDDAASAVAHAERTIASTPDPDSYVLADLAT